MIFTNNENLANKCRLLRNLAFNDSQRFKHDELGWNYRMTNLQAAIGVAQLERLDEFVLKKRHIGTMYNNLLKSCPHIQLPICKTEYSDNIYWVFGLVISSEINLDAKDLMKMLHERGIGSRPFFYPMHLQPIFIQMGLFVNQDFPVANNLSKKGLYLPSGLATTDAQIIQVTNILLDILKEY
jgi:perosamine synthetase